VAAWGWGMGAGAGAQQLGVRLKSEEKKLEKVLPRVMRSVAAGWGRVQVWHRSMASISLSMWSLSWTKSIVFS
jgi:hypothetical protein